MARAFAILRIPLPWLTCLLLEAGGPAPGALPQEPPRATRRALLVGIDHYGAGSVEPLHGAVRDVLLVRKTLVERFGFRPEDVLVLTDREATHAGIVRAFYRHLIATSRADREAGRRGSAVFWFSGHGSRVPDARGSGVSREVDAMDSSLLAFDSRGPGPAGNLDLVDDELGALLQELARTSDHVLAVVDACHSGGGQRGLPDAIGSRTRYVEQADAPPDVARIRAFWPEGVPLGDDELELHDLRGSPNLTFVGACGSRQRAWEVHVDPLEESSVHGLLTYELVRALERARPLESLRAALDRASERVAARRPDQTVSSSGPLDLLPFGGGAVPPTPLCFPAERLIPHEYRVLAGLLQGVTEGALLSFHRDPDGPILATGEVLAVSPGSARVRLVDVEPPDERGLVARVVESTLLPPLRVWTPEEVWKEVFPGDARLRWVARAEADVFLERGPGGQPVLTDPHRRRPRPLGSPDRWLENLGSVVDEERRWLHLAALERVAHGPRVELGLRPVQYEGYLPLPTPRASSGGRSLQVVLRPEGTYALELVGSHAGVGPLYLTFVLVSEDGTVQEIADSIELEPGRLARQPISWRRSPGWSADVGPHERFYALATRNPVDLRGSAPSLRGREDDPLLGIATLDLQVRWEEAE